MQLSWASGMDIRKPSPAVRLAERSTRLSRCFVDLPCHRSSALPDRRTGGSTGASPLGADAVDPALGCVNGGQETVERVRVHDAAVVLEQTHLGRRVVLVVLRSPGVAGFWVRS